MQLDPTILLRDQKLPLIISAISFVLAATLYHLNKFNYWKLKGIKGPKPIPIFGNILAFLFCDRGKLEIDFVHKYGKVYGCYDGTKPILAIADPEVLRQICIKDFDVFPDHQLFHHLNIYQKSFLFFTKGNQWKKIRALMSPSFTSGKIRKVFKFLNDCSEDLLEKIRDGISSNDGIIVAKQLYSHYTLDALATFCYNIRLGKEKVRSGQKDETTMRDDFVQTAEKMFQVNPFRFFAPLIVPGYLLSKLGFSEIAQSPFDPMADRVKALVKVRRDSGGNQFDDYLQLLINSGANVKLELAESDSKEDHHAAIDSESAVDHHNKLIQDVVAEIGEAKLTLTDQEILSSAMLIIVVGLETTGTLLANCTYALAFHPEIQEKLYQELKNIAEYDEDKDKYSFEYDTLTSCLYLDSVISETLRSMPPVLLTDRLSSRDYVIEKYNISLPAGSNVRLAIQAVHHCPDYWQEPEKFNPDRFMPGNREKIVPGSYCPFGLGPRHCIGMRFSLTETKLALAKTLMTFKVEPAPGTCYPPEAAKFNVGLSTFKNLIVKFNARAER